MVMLKNKRYYVLFADIVNLNLAVIFGYILHYGFNDLALFVQSVAMNLMILTGIKVFIYKYFKLYDSVWEYVSDEELIRIVSAVSISTVAGIVYLQLFNVGLFYGVYLYTFLFEMTLAVAVRFGLRLYRRLAKDRRLREHEHNNILIIGTGATACLIAAEIKNHPEVYGRIVGFVDDEKDKYYKTISGIRVIGNYKDIYGVVNRFDVQEIIIALPTINGKSLRLVVEECNRSKAKVRLLPGVRELIDGQVTLDKLRNVSIEDVMEMNEVIIDAEDITGQLSRKTVLVTGAGNLIGAEIARALVRYDISKLILTDMYENTVYDLQIELRKMEHTCDIDVMIASNNDVSNLEKIFKQHKPQIVFHTGIYRKQGIDDNSVMTVIKNNIFGTMNIFNKCGEHDVEKVIYVSSDKNLNPQSTLGLCKRLNEMTVQYYNRCYVGTAFAITRVAEVVNKHESIVNRMKEQIKQGGPITIPHREAIRRYILGNKAAKFIISSAIDAEGGEIFRMDLGEPVKLYDLAEKLIFISGYQVDEDIEIMVTGLRPGEKIQMDFDNAHEVFVNSERRNLKVSHYSYENLFPYDTMKTLYKSVVSADYDTMAEVLEDMMDIQPVVKGAKDIIQSHKEHLKA